MTAERTSRKNKEKRVVMEWKNTHTHAQKKNIYKGEVDLGARTTGSTIFGLVRAVVS